MYHNKGERYMLVKDAVKITDSLTGQVKCRARVTHFQHGNAKQGPSFGIIQSPLVFFVMLKKNNYVRYPAIKAAQYQKTGRYQTPVMGRRNGCTNQADEVVQVARRRRCTTH